MEKFFKSILFCDDTNKQISRVNDDTFNDIMLDKVIDKANLLYLSYYCTYNDIKYRHEIFNELLNGELYDCFKMLDNMLSALDQSFDALNVAKSEYEKVICAYNVCVHYCNIYDYILTIKSNSFFINRLKSQITQMKDSVEHIKNELNFYDALCKKMRSCVVSTSGNYCVFYPFNENLQCWYELIDTYSKSLEWSNSNTYQQTLSIDQNFADAVANIYHDELVKMRVFYNKYVVLLQRDIILYRKEIHFYLAICNLVKTTMIYKIPFCLPYLSDEQRFVVKDAYDVTLVYSQKIKAIPNDIDFNKNDGLFFLTGANGGGKTTYLRTVCVNLIFAIAGCPVFGTSAIVFPFNHVYTHFPMTEKIDKGRYAAEKERIDDIISILLPNDFVFLNETFSGTDMQKGTDAALDVAKRIQNKNAFMLYVTHFHNVSKSDISLLTTEVYIDKNSALRTYKIVKNKAAIKSYAYDILKKYGLSKDVLTERFGDIFGT